MLGLGTRFPAAAGAMCDRLGEFLTRRQAVYRGEPVARTVEKPDGFQPVTRVASASRRSAARYRESSSCSRCGCGCLDPVWDVIRHPRQAESRMTGSPPDLSSAFVVSIQMTASRASSR